MAEYVFFQSILNCSTFYIVRIQTVLIYQKLKVAQQASHGRHYIYVEEAEKQLFELTG